MRFTIILTTETDDGFTATKPITVIERAEHDILIDHLGLRIEESKSLLATLQVAMVRTPDARLVSPLARLSMLRICKAAQGSSLDRRAHPVREDRSAEPQVPTMRV